MILGNILGSFLSSYYHVESLYSALMKLWQILPAFLALSYVQGQSCPDYTEYSQTAHGTPSAGPLALPYMRPDPACRTFNSSAVEVRSFRRLFQITI